MIESFIVEPLVHLLAAVGVIGAAGVGMVVMMAPIAVLTRSAGGVGKGRLAVGLLVGLGVAFWMAILVAAPVLAL